LINKSAHRNVPLDTVINALGICHILQHNITDTECVLAETDLKHFNGSDLISAAAGNTHRATHLPDGVKVSYSEETGGQQCLQLFDDGFAGFVDRYQSRDDVARFARSEFCC